MNDSNHANSELKEVSAPLIIGSEPQPEDSRRFSNFLAVCQETAA